MWYARWKISKIPINLFISKEREFKALFDNEKWIFIKTLKNLKLMVQHFPLIILPKQSILTYRSKILDVYGNFGLSKGYSLFLEGIYPCHWGCSWRWASSPCGNWSLRKLYVEREHYSSRVGLHRTGTDFLKWDCLLYSWFNLFSFWSMKYCKKYPRIKSEKYLRIQYKTCIVWVNINY